MARPLRITYPGAFYHVTSRGYLSSKNKSITGGVVKIVVYTDGILIPFLFHIFRCQGTEDGIRRIEDGRRGRAMSRKILSFRDLEVYKTAFTLQQEIFEISKGFPKEELYSLTDQIRRSSRSIGANVAEAWHKRRYKAHFVSKLSDSDGEQAETQHWLDTALACKYISSIWLNSFRTYLRNNRSCLSRENPFLKTSRK